MKQPVVYIMANKPLGTLYIGVTSDPVKRVWEHKNSLVGGFSQRYAVHSLVYYETHEDMIEVITREKQLKKWNREWKLRLIQQMNPKWLDLYETLV